MTNQGLSAQQAIRISMQRQRHQNYQQPSNQEIADEAELDREYRELRSSSRMNRGLIDVDAQSTLSDGLLWMTDSTDVVTEAQRYADYLYDGGTEAADRYMLDFGNLRPSISNMQHPAYKEWYRHNIYNRWCRDRNRGTGFTTDIDLVDLISMWMSYRPSPWFSDSSSAPSSLVDSSFESDNQPWHPVPPHLTTTMTPPPSPPIHFSHNSNRYSPLAVDEDDEADADPYALTTSL